jgi:hypothetical protein
LEIQPVTARNGLACLTRLCDIARMSKNGQGGVADSTRDWLPDPSRPIDHSHVVLRALPEEIHGPEGRDSFVCVACGLELATMISVAHCRTQRALSVAAWNGSRHC